MNLAAIRQRSRVFLDDTATPYLWSDAFLNESVNQAQVEACTRSELIVDAYTAATSQITILAGTAEYPLDPRVLSVKRAALASDLRSLPKSSAREIDRNCQGFADFPVGSPRVFYIANSSRTLGLYPAPRADDTLNLEVWRLPLVDMVDDADEPEIPMALHAHLAHWACYMALLHGTSERQDIERANIHLGQFTTKFGPERRADEFLCTNGIGASQRAWPRRFGGIA